MFKGFQNKSRQFNGFPNLNFQVNNEAYGFSGCTFWLDAAYGLNTQTNLAAVSSWTDRISGASFTQSTAANQPRYIQSSLSYNNFPVIDFYTSARFLSSLIKYSGFSTIAFIANYDTLTDRNSMIGNVNQTEPLIALGGNSFNGISIALNDGPPSSAGTTDNTNVKICVINSSDIFVNGISEFSGTTRLTQVNFNRIGQWVNIANALVGKVAEIIIYKYSLTNSECIELSTRLNSKYAIY